MKKIWKKIIRGCVSVCRRCYGMGVIELPNGDTKECDNCKGKGVI